MLLYFLLSMSFSSRQFEFCRAFYTVFSCKNHELSVDFLSLFETTSATFFKLCLHWILEKDMVESCNGVFKKFLELL